jgi:glucosamine-6-phosphate deaminase
MEVRVAETAAELGRMAAQDIGVALRARLEEQSRARMILAAAPSQSAMLAALLLEPGIDWPRVTAFHMDEYLGLPENASQRFGSWLTREFFSQVPIGKIHLIDGTGDAEVSCRAYASLLREAPIDIVLLGVGTNGHLAFNDPPADLDDPEMVRVVTLDQMCRKQQVFDGCFGTLDDVPRRAITLTVPTLMAGEELFCCVPGAHKSEAVNDMLEAPVSGACPATALRRHARCTVYLDRESSALSKEYGRG